MRDMQPEIERLNAGDAREWLRLAMQGDLTTAWTFSDRIRARTSPRQDPGVPRHLQQIWDGTSLSGRRVLIRCYHGLGDTIQFIRYIPAVRLIACEVIVWVQPRLLPLLRTLPSGIRLLPLHDGTPAVDYDVDVEIMELPYVFRTSIHTIPCAVPYLDATPTPFEGNECLRVGIVWRAGDWDDRRSIPFDVLKRLLTVPHVRWYSLQHDPKGSEQHPNLHPLDNATVQRSAEHMRGLDLVISVDSMPAHLAGALGVPIWTLLAHTADWRWMEGRNDSPWYPTMRLFRQGRAGNWTGLLTDVQSGLHELILKRTEPVPAGRLAAADRHTSDL
jgi:hypothetical protein